MKDIDNLKLYMNDSMLTFMALEKAIYKIVEGNKNLDEWDVHRLNMTLEEFGSCFDDLMILLNEELEEYE